MKEDLGPAPEEVPTKRNVLQDEGRTPTIWIRQWLGRDNLWIRDRKRLERELERRQEAKPQVKLAIIAGKEGVTPHQVRKTRELLERMEPTEVAFVGRVAKIAHLFSEDAHYKADYYSDITFGRDVVRDATVVIAYPKEADKPHVVNGVWDLIRFAKHRNTPVRIVMPNGELTEGR